jgi:hypothetical protein
MRYLEQGYLWRSGPPDIYGQPTYESPEIFNHRWEQKSGLFIDDKGRQESFKSRVYMDKEPKPGDRISRKLIDNIEKSFEVKDVRVIFSVSGKKSEVRVLL